MESIIACSTASLKEVNEDYCAVIKNTIIPFNGIIVADGLGSHKYSDKASEFVTKFIQKSLETINDIQNLDFEKLFRDAKNALVEYAKNETEIKFEELNKDFSLSTTLICAIETEKNFIIAYIGNGSIWQIRDSFNQLGTSRYLPWSSLNLLNPHCVDEGGKAALYRYITIGDVQPSPTVISISKNSFSSSDWIMIATDGIYSYDNVIIGKDEDGKIWISGEEVMEMFYKEISALFIDNPMDLTDGDLQFSLERYLLEIKNTGLMNDDCSIAVIIPSSILKYQHTVVENRKAKIDETSTSN